MKKNISRVLTFVLMLAMVVTALVIPNTEAKAASATKIHLSAFSDWYNDSARFAACFKDANGTETWVDCSDLDYDRIYDVEVPSGSTQVIFCRMNPNAKENKWDNKWNCSKWLDIPTDDKILCHVDGWNDRGEWRDSTTGFYVFGSMNNWTQADAYKMTYTGGVYKLVLELEAGDYKFKLNNAAGYWAPNNNVALNLEEKKEVTITFDPATGNVEATGVVKPAEGYYVLGLGGADDWSIVAGKNYMTESNGNYVLETTLAAGTYTYKVRHTNGTWYPNGGNLTLDIENECKVTITLNGTTKEVTATGSGIKQPEKLEEGFYLVGIDNVWDCVKGNMLTKSGDSYILEREFKAGTYSYKILHTDGTWYPEGMGNNLTFTVSADGNVKFTFDSASGKTVVTGANIVTDVVSDSDNDEIGTTGDFSMTAVYMLILAGCACVAAGVVSKKKMA